MTSTAIESSELRACLGRFATGATVVSYCPDSEPRGAAVNVFSAVSLEPPLVLVPIACRAKACPLLENAPFPVNVLSSRQVAVALTPQLEAMEQLTEEFVAGWI